MIPDEDILVLDQPKLGAAERLFLPQIVEGMKTTLGHLGKSLLHGLSFVLFIEGVVSIGAALVLASTELGGDHNLSLLIFPPPPKSAQLVCATLRRNFGEAVCE